jgi:hypothetical protein
MCIRYLRLLIVGVPQCHLGTGHHQLPGLIIPGKRSILLDHFDGGVWYDAAGASKDATCAHMLKRHKQDRGGCGIKFTR